LDQPVDDRGHALAAAETHVLQVGLIVVELDEVAQGAGNAGTSGANRPTDTDNSIADVDNGLWAGRNCAEAAVCTGKALLPVGSGARNLPCGSTRIGRAQTSIGAVLI
jgi:hypothetical protein